MEPTTLATATIATLFASEAVKAGGKAFGEGTSKLVSQLLTVIRNKFKAAETEGLLTRLEQQPTDSNIDRFKTEFLIHIEEDQEFADQLKDLLAKPEAEEIVRQLGIEKLKATGDLELKGLDQEVTGGKLVEQTGLSNVEAAGDITLGKLSQKRLKS
jgi:hypothetical protein